MMGLFGNKKESMEEITIEKSEEVILKEELEAEVEKLQNEFRAKTEEIKEHGKNLQVVKEEYNSTVTNLMEIKKEINQKKMELDVVKREYRDTKQKIEGADEIYQKNKKLINELEKTETSLKNTNQELEESIKKDIEIKEMISEGQSILHEIKSQEIQTQKELEEITSRLYNAKQELGNSDNTSVFTDKEKEFIKDQIGGKQDTKSIIEAASAVTASLKSKLNMSQKELETVQLLLEKERKEHELTKEKLKKYNK
jgi:chromosome segregation ATPase